MTKPARVVLVSMAATMVVILSWVLPYLLIQFTYHLVGYRGILAIVALVLGVFIAQTFTEEKW